MLLATLVNKGAGRRKELSNVENLPQEIQLPVPEDKLDEQDKYIKRALTMFTVVPCPSSPTKQFLTTYQDSYQGHGRHYLKEVVVTVRNIRTVHQEKQINF
jgi:hypothetical protein